MWFFGVYLTLNMLTFIAFGIDKRRAIKHRYRISEKTLLLLALFGPIGGIVGMQFFRHKTQKKKFKWLVPGFVCIHLTVFGMTTTVLASEAESPSAWAQSEFQAAADKGYITDSMYDDLQEDITRGQFVDLIMESYEQMFGVVDDITDDENPFSDTDDLAIVKAYALGIVSGDNNGDFNPDQLITREEMVQMFMGLNTAIEARTEVTLLSDDEPESFDFDDTDEIDSWALESMEKAVANGIVSGTGNNEISPKGNSTKQQAIIMTLRLFDIYEQNDSLSDYLDIYVNALEESEVADDSDTEEDTDTSSDEDSQDTTTTDSDDDADDDEPEVGYVNTAVLRLRSEPSDLPEDELPSDTIIGKLSYNTAVTILDDDGTWYKVTTSAGQTGYLYKKYVLLASDAEEASEATQSATASTTTTVDSSTDRDELAQEIIAFAEQYVGLRYVYGGTSFSTGMDCSAFTQQVMRQFGISINRSSSAQMSNGYSVSRSELEPGDLVFYGYSGHASHVAIYIGNGEVIHETVPGTGVKITDIDWVSKPYIGARRVF